MARGWESKAVESQQADAAHSQASGPVRSPEEVARASHRAGLELALAQTHAEIGAACRPAHREMLSLRLAAIKEQLAAEPL